MAVARNHPSSRMQLILFAVLATTAVVSNAYPDGAPTSVCNSLVPAGHTVGSANDQPGGFFIDTELRDDNFAFMAGETYNGKRALWLSCECELSQSLIFKFAFAANVMCCSCVGSISDGYGRGVSWLFDPST